MKEPTKWGLARGANAELGEHAKAAAEAGFHELDDPPDGEQAFVVTFPTSWFGPNLPPGTGSKSGYTCLYCKADCTLSPSSVGVVERTRASVCCVPCVPKLGLP